MKKRISYSAVAFLGLILFPVAVIGGPAVEVINDSTNPVPVVRAVEPVYIKLWKGDSYTVPGGMRLHIKFITVRASNDDDANDVVVSVGLADPGPILKTTHVADLAPFSGPYAIEGWPHAFILTRTVSIYVDAGKIVSLYCRDETEERYFSSHIYGELMTMEE